MVDVYRIIVRGGLLVTKITRMGKQKTTKSTTRRLTSINICCHLRTEQQDNEDDNSNEGATCDQSCMRGAKKKLLLEVIACVFYVLQSVYAQQVGIYYFSPWFVPLAMILFVSSLCRTPFMQMLAWVCLSSTERD